MTIWGNISMTWRDVLDIILLTALFYQIILLIRGTRAVSAIFGLIFLVIAYVISGHLGLYTLHWLLQNFLGSLFLIVVILFQRDIRQGLSSIGARNFLLFRRKEALSENTQNAIVEAADSMSHSRIGALIVIQRGMDLGDIAKGRGTLLDAVITSNLLIALFYPKSPMHDGAVIIAKDRVFKAGCILPLADDDPNRSYGTRHRAALGISEQSDAVVVVVSEERGTMSVAVSGTLTPCYTKAKLVEKLKEELKFSDGDKRK